MGNAAVTQQERCFGCFCPSGPAAAASTPAGAERCRGGRGASAAPGGCSAPGTAAQTRAGRAPPAPPFGSGGSHPGGATAREGGVVGRLAAPKWEGLSQGILLLWSLLDGQINFAISVFQKKHTTHNPKPHKMKRFLGPIIS